MTDPESTAIDDPRRLAPGFRWQRLCSPPDDRPLAAAGILERVTARLAAPTSGVALAEHLRAPVLVVVPDATRSTGVRPMFAAVDAALDALGIDPRARRVLVAGGTHRPPTSDELALLLGDAEAAGRAAAHDCRDHSRLTGCGSTRRGTPVEIATALFEAGSTILIGGITGHYFAGFTGGLKGLVPGAAGHATVLANHRLAVDPTSPSGLHPACAEGSLAGNPVHADFVEAARRAPAPFLVNAVIGASGAVVDVVTGDAEPAHARGVELARRAATPVATVAGPGALAGGDASTDTGALAGRADLVVVETSDTGRQRDWIQAHKLVRQGAVYARDGGVLVARLACTDGIGSDSLLEWMAVPAADLSAAVAARYTLHGHTALAMRALCQRLRVILISALPPAEVRRLGMVPAPSMAAALSAARTSLPAGGQALWIDRAGALLPPIAG